LEKSRLRPARPGVFSDSSFVSGGCAPGAKSVVFAA